ncbi:hypothetical protein HDZ31DRAFT_33893 [Schizophyllum fasciatum]
MTNADEETMVVSCPDCRTPFKTVMPENNLIPRHLRPFVQPSVRRLYLNAPEDTSNRIKALERDKAQLLTSCERHMAAAARHRDGEHEERTRARALDSELQRMKTSYRDLSALYNARVKELQEQVQTLQVTVRQREDDIARMRTTAYSARVESDDARRDRKKRKTISPISSVASDDDEPPTRPSTRVKKSLPRRSATNHPTAAEYVVNRSQPALGINIRDFYEAVRKNAPPHRRQEPVVIEHLREVNRQRAPIVTRRADGSISKADQSGDAGPSSRRVYVVSDSSDDEVSSGRPDRSSTRKANHVRDEIVEPTPPRLPLDRARSRPFLQAPPKRRRVNSPAPREDDSDSFDSENDTDDDLSEMYPGRNPLVLTPARRTWC